MTAQELIEELSKYPPGTRVEFRFYDDNYMGYFTQSVDRVEFKTAEEMGKEFNLLPQFASDTVVLC